MAKSGASPRPRKPRAAALKVTPAEGDTTTAVTPAPAAVPVPASAALAEPLLPTQLPEEEPAVPPSLAELLARMPTDPGVYLMKDKKGRIIYVGKAANLRNRVRSYFTRSGDNRPFVALLERLLGDIETIVTHNEKEALLLENNLIKQHRPRFNVKLVDDKSYLVLRLDPRAHYPRLEVTRRIREDGARYFGPYHSATSCRQTLQVVNRHFRLRTCTDQVLNSRKRPCLQYQIKRCDAPCVLPVDEGAYGEQVRDVALFLSGKDQELTGRLRQRMSEAAERMEFEVAGAIRDQLRALERTLEEQRVVSAQFVDQDVFGVYREGDVLEIAVLHVRKGKLLGRRTYHFSGQEFPTGESLSSFVGLYYDLGNVIPDEVLLPCDIEDRDAKEEWLRERAAAEGEEARGAGSAGAQANDSRGRPVGARAIEGPRSRRRVEVLVPKRGPRVRLLDLANKNAEVAYKSRRDQRRDTEDALAKLQARLGLKRYPRWIECFDISHLQGSYTVASRVVFIDGEPARQEYRTFKVKTVENNDFASMYEVLSRRLRRAKGWLEQRGGQLIDNRGASRFAIETLEAPGAAAVRQAAAAVVGEGLAAAAGEAPPPLEKTDSWRVPDLLVIDGGKGQLGVALAALKDIGLDLALLDVIGLAKERDDVSGERHPDRVFLPRVKDPIVLRPNTAELFVLSRIRDEAHRFAVTFHKKQRSRGTIRSALADIPGIGPRRQRELLRALGSVRRIRSATLDELLAVPGMTLAAAQAVLDHFHGSGGALASAGAGEGEPLGGDDAGGEGAEGALAERALDGGDGGDEDGHDAEGDEGELPEGPDLEVLAAMDEEPPAVPTAPRPRKRPARARGKAFVGDLDHKGDAAVGGADDRAADLKAEDATEAELAALAGGDEAAGLAALATDQAELDAALAAAARATEP